MFQRKTLERWIQEAITDHDKEGPLTQLSLVHVVATSEEEVHTVKLGAGRDWTPKELAKLFRGKADTEVQDEIGVHVFKVLAFYDNQSEAQSRYKFIVSGHQEDHHGATEPPTAQGLRMQDMRITEGIVRGAMQMMQHVTTVQQQVISNLADENASLRRENVDAIELAKKVILETAAQRTEAELKVEQYKRGTAERQKFLGMIPPLVNTVAGRELFPQASEDTAIIEMFAENITEEQIAQLGSVIPPELMGVLARRLHKSLTKKREEHETALARRNEVEDDAHEVETEVVPEHGQ